MRRVLWFTALIMGAAVVAQLGACHRAEPAPTRRVVILGFDGVEPSIVDAMLAQDRLPNLAALRARGSYHRLGTTIPPQSPAAWASFATCRHPGDHGIYDFIRRDVQTYVPLPGVGATFPHEFFLDGELKRGPRAVSYRQGDTFWRVADEQGARAKLLHIPFAFPPDDLTQGLMLCGAGVPEIGGLTTHFYALSDAYTEAELRTTVAGGVRVKLAFDGDHATVMIPGALSAEQGAGRVAVPLGVTVDRIARTLSLEVQGTRLEVPERAWSDWVAWTLPITPEVSVRAISSFYVFEAGDQVRLYMSSLQYHPEEPYVPITEPSAYAGELYERYGLYKTLGWSHDTNALRRGGLDEDAFLEEARIHDAWLERLTLDEMDRDAYELLVAVWTSPDRVSHTFWRYRDPEHPLYTEEGAATYGHVVEETYERMDSIVGKVLARLAPEDLVLVLSDHGFHSFRKAFSVNTWLVRNGYLALKGQDDPASAHTADENDLLRSVDWGRTRAYALGLGAIYLNVQGREGQGIVDPAGAPALAEELREKLLQVVDPDTGAPVFTAVYGRDAFGGRDARHAPDLQLGYAEGYQTSKASAKGAAPRDIFEPNLDKWSGEHASSDADATPGILFSSVPITASPSIVDLGVTVLRFLGLDVPPEFEGKDLFE
jgi:predicted AlkP superfamily phosphohydrolase/phosphomutase